jgi:hypothetical protein
MGYQTDTLARAPNRFLLWRRDDVPARGRLYFRTGSQVSSSLSDLTANSLILLNWYYFLEAKLLSLLKGLEISMISMMPSPTGC